MNVFDISWPITPAITGYKDKDVASFKDIKHFAADGLRETTICLNSHTGTHIDAPSHFLRDGKTIDEMYLERFMGPCKVLDLMYAEEQITRDELENQNIKEHDIILLKTANSLKSVTNKFDPRFVYLEASGAQYLADKKIKAVGIDYLGIEHSQPGHQTHLALMHADVTIIEGLRLVHVEPGEYQFICLPLYVVGLEAAPARAILMK